MNDCQCTPLYQNWINSKMTLVAQGILFLIFVCVNLAMMLGLAPQPAMEGAAGELMMGFMAAGYLLPLIKATEMVCGFLLLSRKTTPMGLILLAPVVVNILLFHLFLAPEGTGMAVFLTLLETYLGIAYFSRFRSLVAEKHCC